MFAGAAREVVFSNREVVRRVNEEFIPVALKARMVNNPPRGIEGNLYAEIGRSKPAPQGICTVNSAGKVLTWALTFDDDASILKFLDHVASRYKKTPDAKEPVVAERYMRFPSRKMPDVEDTSRLLKIPEQHAESDRCPGIPAVAKGTLVGRIIGRPLDKQGKPITDTTRQEEYMEARFEVSIAEQKRLVTAIKQANDKRFQIPDAFTRSLVSPAFLGQLDANPLGGVPGSQNDSRHWKFTGQTIDSGDKEIIRVRIEGESNVKGGRDMRAKPRKEGRLWEHRVTLKWQGYADVKENRIVQLIMVANGDEQFRWGNERYDFRGAPAATHLMAGHKIDLDTKVRYGLIAKPAASDEEVESDLRRDDHAMRSGRGRFAARPAARSHQVLHAKMQRLKAGVKRMQQAGHRPAEIGKLMQRFQPLVRQRKFKKAEALLDQALKMLK